ncbi:MAG: N-acetylmuramic acid 6-phosphate etherase, partial [Clostridium sp.]|nr:N-acetylmuramic acid 6-phosphate etherase [Clostridium sp.]
KLGKVYGNLMVDVQSTNEKLVERAKKIVSEATGLNIEEATKVLNETNFDVKLAIFMTLSKLDKEEAKSKLDESKGYIAKALDLVNA